MFVCVHSVSVLYYVGLIPPPRSPTDCTRTASKVRELCQTSYIRLRNWSETAFHGYHVLQRQWLELNKGNVKLSLCLTK
jgi:hypothetical protein